jgi:hypothetical protein
MAIGCICLDEENFILLFRGIHRNIKISGLDELNSFLGLSRPRGDKDKCEN